MHLHRYTPTVAIDRYTTPNTPRPPLSLNGTQIVAPWPFHRDRYIWTFTHQSLHTDLYIVAVKRTTTVTSPRPLSLNGTPRPLHGGRYVLTVTHRTLHINRYTSTVTLQPLHTDRYTSTVTLRSLHINIHVVTVTHRPLHHDRDTSISLPRWLHRNRCTATITHLPLQLTVLPDGYSFNDRYTLDVTPRLLHIDPYTFTVTP